MSEYRKANVEGATYFLTLTVVGWIDVFSKKAYADNIIKNLAFCQKEKGLEVFAYVIMSNHLHLVARCNQGLMSDFLRDFKSYTSKELLKLIRKNPHESRKKWLEFLFRYFANLRKNNSKNAFWQRTNHPIELYNNYLIDQKIDYIHQNPVKAGIVYEAHHYVHSSANPDSPLICTTP